MRKLWIFMLLVFVTLLSSQTFWYLEDKVYCNIEGQNVTIFLQWWKWLKKCQAYVDAIYQMAQQTYNEIMLIRGYISQWEDTYYWKKILEQKNSEFLQIVNYRIQIKTAIDTFENSIFNQYSTILKKEMTSYYTKLDNMYDDLSKKNTSAGSLKLMQVEQQMWNVDHILKAKNLDDIMNVLSSYIYLKRRIEWR